MNNAQQDLSGRLFEVSGIIYRSRHSGRKENRMLLLSSLDGTKVIKLAPAEYTPPTETSSLRVQLDGVETICQEVCYVCPGMAKPTMYKVLIKLERIRIKDKPQTDYITSYARGGGTCASLLLSKSTQDGRLHTLASLVDSKYPEDKDAVVYALQKLAKQPRLLDVQGEYEVIPNLMSVAVYPAT